MGTCCQFLIHFLKHEYKWHLIRDTGLIWPSLKVVPVLIMWTLYSCLDALWHTFLCGPRWRLVPSMDIIQWGLGFIAMCIREEYIYRFSLFLFDCCLLAFCTLLTAKILSFINGCARRKSGNSYQKKSMKAQYMCWNYRVMF